MAAAIKPTTRVSDDDPCWGNIWLPAILEAIGGFEGMVYGITLHAEYGMFATATIRYSEGSEYVASSELVRILPHRGTVWLSTALPFGVPRGIQAITIDINEGEFVIVHCRYAPIETPIDAMIAALKAHPEGSRDDSRN